MQRHSHLFIMLRILCFVVFLFTVTSFISIRGPSSFLEVSELSPDIPSTNEFTQMQLSDVLDDVLPTKYIVSEVNGTPYVDLIIFLYHCIDFFWV